MGEPPSLPPLVAHVMGPPEGFDASARRRSLDAQLLPSPPMSLGLDLSNRRRSWDYGPPQMCE